MQELNDIFIEAARICLRIIKPKQKQKKRKKRSCHFNRSCLDLKNKVKSSRKLFLQYPKDPIIKGNYFKTGKAFKRYVRKCKRLSKFNLLQEVERGHYRSQIAVFRRFWKGARCQNILINVK